MLSRKLWCNPRLCSRIQELDGLRGLAILLVLIEHYIRDASSVHLARWESWMCVPFRLAWSGVDLFFVLSGFLIGGILIDAKESLNYYQAFYARRICRIFPLYFLWFGIFLLGLHLSATPHARVPVNSMVLHTLFNSSVPVWSYPLFLQNGEMALHGTTGATWLGITWSLAVEEQFYLLLPVAVRSLTTAGLLRLVCTCFLIAPLLRMLLLRVGAGTLAPYTLLPCRADALGFGVLTAIAVRDERAWCWLASHRKYLYWSLALFSFGACLLTKLPYASPAFMGAEFSVLGALYATLLLLVVVNPGHAEIRVFRWRPLMKVGTISYAIYLFHAGVSFLWHGAVRGADPGINDSLSVFITVCAAITTVALAILSWKVLERPLIAWSRATFRYSMPEPQLAVGASLTKRPAPAVS